MSREMLTTRDLAEYLRINENQIYRLVREKKLPATRITGKWLFPKGLIDEWVTASAKMSVDPSSDPAPIDHGIVIAGSNDIALEFLARSSNIANPDINVSLSSIGSCAGLSALRNGTCHMAAAHLLDTQTGEYNIPILKNQFPDLKITLINFAYREQGLIVKRGNPLGLKTLRDLAKKKASIINRQEGSGTRVLLDHELKKWGIAPSELTGYDKSACTHMEVALEVFHGTADTGIAIRAAAQLLDLDFIPLAKERFDLVIPTEHLSTKAVGAIRKVLASEGFKAQIAQMGGYETGKTGCVLYEKA